MIRLNTLPHSEGNLLVVGGYVEELKKFLQKLQVKFVGPPNFGTFKLVFHPICILRMVDHLTISL